MKKFHAEWDRKKREFKATVAGCSSNRRLNDTPMQKELQSYTQKGDLEDAKLLEMEMEHNGKNNAGNKIRDM